MDFSLSCTGWSNFGMCCEISHNLNCTLYLHSESVDFVFQMWSNGE